jgi:glycerol-3-phosphate O-acyltransferase
VRYLGYRFINAIDHVTVITPHAIVAGAALNCAKQRFTYDHLMADVETYVNHLFLLEAKLADTLLIDYSHAIAYVFETYTNRKFLERIPPQKGIEKSQNLYRVNESRRPVLDYYKNNGIVYFIPAAFTAMAILERDAFQFSTEELFDSYAFLREFFNNEFAFDVDHSPEYFVRKTIKIFMAEAILMPHPELRDTHNLTSAGYRKLKLFASFLKTYFESYWIVLNVFMRYPKSFLDSKNRTKKITSMGNRMYKRREVERIESLSTLNYKNAVDYFTNHGVRGSEDGEAIDRYAQAIRRYLNRIAP